MARRRRRQHWTQTPDSLRNLLSWLDQGDDSKGEAYLEMRRRLVGYFDRKRCIAPDDLADETLTRIARTLDERGVITDMPPGRYCYTVARFVFLEYLRSDQRRQVSVDADPGVGHEGATSGDETPGRRDRLLDALERCMAELTGADRELIVEYYRGARGSTIEHRKRLAAERGMTPNALMIRACRIRGRLEACINHRVAEDGA